ncbi:hypothetical protein THIOSC15_1870002 [uncultured Thiomicrorhabdus sp.]
MNRFSLTTIFSESILNRCITQSARDTLLPSPLTPTSRPHKRMADRRRRRPRTTSRIVLFTWNNPTNGTNWTTTLDEWNQLDALRRRRLRALVYQFEIAPTTGTLHVQGAIRLDGTVRIGQAVRIVHELLRTGHVTLANGSWADQVAYCSKDDSRAPDTEPVRLGDWEVQQGKRSDLELAINRIKEGATDLDLVNEFPATYARYAPGLSRARVTLAAGQARSTPPRIIVLYGESGRGKSHFCRSSFPDAAWIDGTNHKWWDGYCGGKQVVVLDDFDGAGWPFRFLLRVLDKYPLRLEKKGGFVYANYDVICITSNLHPENWYNLPAAESRPLMRRLEDFGQVICVNSWPGDRDVAKWNPDTRRVHRYASAPTRPAERDPVDDDPSVL